MEIRLRRIYETPNHTDGYRILVDRLWPRGISKKRAQIQSWAKELAPSSELRKRYHKAPENWNEFKEKYFAELDDKKTFLSEVLDLSDQEKVTFVYSARDERFNNAVALKEYVDRLIK